MLVQGPTLRDAACIWITKYDGYTLAKRFRMGHNTSSTAKCIEGVFMIITSVSMVEETGAPGGNHRPTQVTGRVAASTDLIGPVGSARLVLQFIAVR